MMDTPKHAIARFIEAVRVIQQQATCFNDVRAWLLSNAQILREVSTALGHRGYGPAYNTVAKIHRLDMEDHADDGLGLNDLTYTDEWCTKFQVETFCGFITDQTIDLPLIIEHVPEFGLFMNLDEYQGNGRIESLVFTPKYWAFAAGMMLHHLDHTDVVERYYLSNMLASFHPTIDLETYSSLYSADLFTHSREVTHWLIQSQSKLDVARQIPCDLI